MTVQADVHLGRIEEVGVAVRTPDEDIPEHKPGVGEAMDSANKQYADPEMPAVIIDIFWGEALVLVIRGELATGSSLAELRGV